MYTLDLSKLQLGDVILESGNTKIISSAIKNVTKSPFSHALIYIGGSLIHATPKGVFSRNPQRLLTMDPCGLKVLRAKTPLDPAAQRAICDYAAGLVGSLYSNKEAVRSIKNNKRPQAKNRKQFCSRLVAQSYQSQGIHLVDNPDYCTPEQLNASSLLETIPECLTRAEVSDIKLYLSKDPNLEIQKETFKWLKKARRLFRRRAIKVQTLNDVSQALMRKKRLDKRICQYIHKTRYLEQYKVDRQSNSYRYDLEAFLATLKQQSNPKAFIAQEIELVKGLNEQYAAQLEAIQRDIDKANLEYSRLHLALCRNHLMELKIRRTVLERAVEINLNYGE